LDILCSVVCAKTLACSAGTATTWMMDWHGLAQAQPTIPHRIYSPSLYQTLIFLYPNTQFYIQPPPSPTLSLALALSHNAPPLPGQWLALLSNSRAALLPSCAVAVLTAAAVAFTALTSSRQSKINHIFLLPRKILTYHI